MSIYGDETRKLMARDIEAWKAERERKRNLVQAALSEANLTDEEATSILESALIYGWRLPDGTWRPSPKYGKRA